MKKIGSVVSLSFLMTLMLVAPVVGSSNWMKFSKDDQGNIFSYKKGNIVKDDGVYIVQVWEKKVYAIKGGDALVQRITKDGISTEGYDNLSEEMSLIGIDCKKQMGRVLSINKYDTDGKELLSTQFDNPEWKYIVPDSRWDALRKKVCVTQKKTSKKKKK